MKKKIVLFVLITAFALSICGCTVFYRPSGVAYYTYSNTTEYYGREDELSFANAGGSCNVNMVKNEWESGQFIIKNLDSEISNVVVEVGDFYCGDIKLAEKNIVANRIHYFTRSNEAAEAYTVSGAFIPLTEYTNNISVEKGKNQAFVVKFYADESTVAGTYNGNVLVKYDGGSLTVPFVVTVYDVTIPETSTLETYFVNRIYSMADYYGDLLTSSELSEMYLDFALDYRYSVAGGYELEDTSTPEATAKSYKKLLENDPRISVISLGLWRPYVPGGTIDIAYSTLRPLIDALVAEGIADKFVFYPTDEPEKTQGEREWTLELLKQLKEAYPEVRTVLTASPIESYYAPQTTLFTPFYYPSLADDVAYYGKQAPVWTYFLKTARSDAWYESGSDITGYLHWEYGLADVWTGADWDESSGHYENATPEQLWNGETSAFTIPAKVGDGIVNENKPIATLATEGLRDSQEDYEKLVLFREKAKELYNKLGITEYTFNECLKSVYANVYKPETYMAEDIPHAALSQMNLEIIDAIQNGINNFTVIRENRTAENPNGYTVEIFAEKGFDVKAGGKEADSVIDMGSYAKYVFNMTATEANAYFTVSVNGAEYHKTLRMQIYGKYIQVFDIKNNFEAIKQSILSQRRTTIKSENIEKVELGGKAAMKITLPSSSDYFTLPNTEFITTDWTGAKNLYFNVLSSEQNSFTDIAVKLYSGGVGDFAATSFNPYVYFFDQKEVTLSLKTIPENKLSEKQSFFFSLPNKTTEKTTVYITDFYIGE